MLPEDPIETARILFVDDDPATVVLLERLFRQAGYGCLLSTTDGSEVEDLCATFEPDLIILDLSLPPCDGLVVLEQIQELTRGAHYLPVIVLTGAVEPEKKVQALMLGAKDFVSKPFDAFEFMLRVRMQLETRFLFRSLTGPSPSRPAPSASG